MNTKATIIGLTGSIGAGKSTLARMMKKRGAAVFNADLAVRDLWAHNARAKKFAEKYMPEAIVRGKISRKKIAARLFSDKALCKKTEDFLHPLVYKETRAFIRFAREKDRAVIVLDIPLLFEAGFDRLCDLTCCASAPLKIQTERVLQRPHMSEKLYHAIRKRQWSDRKKRAAADIVFKTDCPLEETEKQVESFIKSLEMTEKSKRGKHA